MASKKIKPENSQSVIFSGQSVNGLLVKVIQNTLPNYERSKYLIQTTKTDYRGVQRNRIVAKSNDVRKVSELLSVILGHKITLL